MLLEKVEYIRPENTKEYPFNISLLKEFNNIEFKKPITIFVGENGTGKSTILEGIAAKAESITIGGKAIEDDPMMEPARKLGQQLRLEWRLKNNKGFYLRAEDFISYINKISDMKEDMKKEIERIDIEYKDRSKKARDLAKMPYQNSLAKIEHQYGEGLEKLSHGESFLKFFESRFVPGGLYILDEPETPLSPTKQIAFMSMIKHMINGNSQFIIATHSPMLMAMPDAQIISFDNSSIREVSYEELEHVNITKDFLNNPDSYLRYI